MRNKTPLDNESKAMRKKWAVIALLGIIVFLLAITAGLTAAWAASKPVDRKTFNAIMDQQYPNGRGPSSTSRGRGFYRGLNGDWRRR